MRIKADLFNHITLDLTDYQKIKLQLLDSTFKTPDGFEAIFVTFDSDLKGKQTIELRYKPTNELIKRYTFFNGQLMLVEQDIPEDD